MYTFCKHADVDDGGVYGLTLSQTNVFVIFRLKPSAWQRKNAWYKMFCAWQFHAKPPASVATDTSLDLYKSICKQQLIGTV